MTYSSFVRPKACDFQVFLDESLHHPNTRKILLGVGRNVAKLILHEAVASLESAAHDRHGDRHERQNGECHQRELPVDNEHQDRHDDEHNDRADQADHAHADKLANCVEIVGQAGHEIAGVHLAIESLVERLQVAEGRISEVVFEKPGNAIHRAALHEREDRLPDCGTKKQEHVAREVATGHVLLQVVDCQAQYVRLNDSEKRARQYRHHADHDPPGVSAQVRYDVFQMLHCLKSFPVFGLAFAHEDAVGIEIEIDDLELSCFQSRSKTVGSAGLDCKDATPAAAGAACFATPSPHARTRSRRDGPGPGWSPRDEAPSDTSSSDSTGRKRPRYSVVAARPSSPALHV